MLATALMIAVVFLGIFFIVRYTVYSNIDQDLTFEAQKHQVEVVIKGDSIYVTDPLEWEEREHQEVQVSPVFIQFTNKRGICMDKSPNLKSDTLSFVWQNERQYFNTQISQRPIRQVQIPIIRENQVKGYILAAMSLDAAQIVFRNLGGVLLASYPLILFVLFLASRYLAGKNIEPIQHISRTTQQITQYNLEERVQLPNNQDELYDLSANINQLLDRISEAMKRERQFTSNASHELRTPLSVLRGTLEILGRKQRSIKEYQDGIHKSLHETDRIEHILQQLLFIARFEHNTMQPTEKSAISSILEESLLEHSPAIIRKDLEIQESGTPSQKPVPRQHAQLILGNILSNAIKYSKPHGSIYILWDKNMGCTIKDEGIGIEENDLASLFTPFFRSAPLQHKEIAGTGLGLSIAKKAADAIGATIHIESQLGKGTTVTITW